MTEMTTEPGSAEIFLNFDLKLSSILSELKKANKLEQQRLGNQPNSLTLYDVFNGSGTTYLKDFGGPANGRIWHVRLVAVTAQPFAANAAVATVYVGQNVQSGLTASNELPVSFVRWQFPSIPSFQKYSPGEIPILTNEHLLIGLGGIPASSNIGITVTIIDEPLKRAASVVES